MLFSFVDALVNLTCGPGNVVSVVTTNSAGAFSIVLNPSQFSLAVLLSSCNIVIATPLSTCNSSLPDGVISAPLQLVGTTLEGLLTVFHIIPRLFNRVN